MEIWKSVDGFLWLEVSNLGRVRTLDSLREGIKNGKPHTQIRKGCVLSPWLGSHGYLQVAPKIGSLRKKLLVHRLVAMTFVHGHFDGATVNHIDGDKTNNQASNLEWLSLSDNTKHQWRIGLANLRGKNNKLTPADVVSIRNSDKTNSALADAYGVTDGAICMIRQRKRWAWLD